jgi:hypothetical protein
MSKSNACYLSLVDVGSKSDWILLEEGNLKGMNIVVDHETGDVLSFSTRFCRDVDRWTAMPSLAQYETLQMLDLHNSRYLVQLHDSVGSLKKLRSLILSNCESLVGLPESLGELKNLQEVCRNWWLDSLSSALRRDSMNNLCSHVKLFDSFLALFRSLAYFD